MKIALLACCFFLLGASPVREVYNKPVDIKAEFTNAYYALQDKQFTIINSTPNVTEMREGEIILFSSNSVKFLIRISTTIYQIELTKNPLFN